MTAERLTIYLEAFGQYQEAHIQLLKIAKFYRDLVDILDNRPEATQIDGPDWFEFIPRGSTSLQRINYDQWPDKECAARTIYKYLLTLQKARILYRELTPHERESVTRPKPGF